MVLDGEVVTMREGLIECGALSMSPRSRAAAGVNVPFVAFDFVSQRLARLRPDPLRLRRAGLERLMAGVEVQLRFDPGHHRSRRPPARRWSSPRLMMQRC